ncbi:MAG TPA: hypothetical protein VLS90_17445 [Thermodesulfobacteriota bacterium]|nr:hypothetical protein [Thermodesulfobacteriota bacterium]
MEEIILWECNGENIQACLRAVHETLKDLGLHAVVTVHSEPPLIGRNQLWKRLPVLEIRGLHWSLRPGCAFRAEELKPLFSRVFHPHRGGGIVEEPGKEDREKKGRVSMDPVTLTDGDFKSKL